MDIIIAGAHSMGSYLVKLLERSNANITIIDEDKDSIERLRSEGYDINTKEGSPVSIEVLKDVDTKHAKLFIAVTGNQEVNLCACAFAKSLGAEQTVARVDEFELAQPGNEDIIKRMGVDSVIYPESLGAKDIINGLKMSWARMRWDVHDGALVMLGIKLREECTILNQPLKDICGPNDPYHIVAIKRGNETIIPNGNHTLQIGDLAFFMTTKDKFSDIREKVGKEDYADVENVMIVSGGKLAARTVAEMPDDMSVKIIEVREDRCNQLNALLPNRGDKIMVIKGDGRDMQLLKEEGIENMQAFVALTPDAETNILTCLAAKRMGVRKTVALVENFGYAELAESLDIGTIINKKSISASHIYKMLLDSNVENIRYIMAANAHVGEFVAEKGSKVTKKIVSELELPKGVTLGGIVRDNKGILVSGNTQIQTGDIVVVFCHDIYIKQIEKYFK